MSRFNPLNAEGELTKDGVNELSNRKNKIIDGLRNVEADYSPIQ